MDPDSEIQFNYSDPDNNYCDTDSEKEKKMLMEKVLKFLYLQRFLKVTF